MSTQRDELAQEIFIADNSNQAREASLKDWDELNKTMGAGKTYAHNIANGLLAAGWEAPAGNHFKLEASLTSGETVTVKVSGYSNMRQGCAALVKVADVQTLSQLIASSEDDEDQS